MKNILFFFVFSASIFSADAQIVNDYYGAIKLNDTSVITYRINFKIVDNFLSGYSMTDISGEHETKSNITGKYDKENELISFNETGIIYTKSPVSQNDFCNVYFLPSKFKLGKSKVLKGKFDGRFSDGTKCIDGEILLNSVEQVKKRIEKVSKKVNKSKRVADSIKEKFNNIKILKAANTNYLKKDEITSVFTKSEIINLYVYDGGKIDDDVITILKDGKIILYKHKVSEKKELIEVLITSNKTRITVLSVSEGTIGTNTAVIEIVDSNNTIKTMTNLKEGEKTEIDFIKR
jgi:hypothetical protein